MQARAYGSNRASERARGIRVAQLVQVAQHDGFAIAHRQGNDAFAQRVKMPAPFDVAERINVDPQYGCTRVLVRKREHRTDGTGATRVVAGDAEQPQPGRRLTWTIAACASDHRDKRFVDDVFSGGGGTAHVRGKPADVSPIPAIELGERLAVTRGDARDQNVVRQYGDPHIFYSVESGKGSTG